MKTNTREKAMATIYEYIAMTSITRENNLKCVTGRSESDESVKGKEDGKRKKEYRLLVRL